MCFQDEVLIRLKKKGVKAAYQPSGPSGGRFHISPLTVDGMSVHGRVPPAVSSTHPLGGWRHCESTVTCLVQEHN